MSSIQHYQPFSEKYLPKRHLGSFHYVPNASCTANNSQPICNLFHIENVLQEGD